MPRDLQLTAPTAGDEREPHRLAVRRGAELVHLAEEFYVRIFAVACVILIAGCGLALWFATLDRGVPRATTLLFVATAAVCAVAALARPRSSYRRLRSRRALQLSPAALGALAVLVDGPESECWWIALPLLWLVATLSSTGLTIGAAIVTAAAFVAGTVLGEQPLIGAGDLGVLPATIALPTYSLVGVILINAFVRLVLEGRHSPPETEQQPLPPRRVTNLATPRAARTAPSTALTTAPRWQPARSRLTARQLEITLLLRDGLRQTEIADCLGITARQVERHIAAARQRVHASTTTHLVAMLASGALTHHRPASTPPGVDSHA